MAIPEAKETKDGAGRNSARPSVLSFRMLPPGGWIAIAGVALIYAGHLSYGALRNDVALAMNIAAALMLGGALISPRLRQDVARLQGIVAPAALFAVVVLVASWTLTPWTPGGPHPVWAYVSIAPGSSTIDKSATTMEIVKLLGLGCIFAIGAATGAKDDRARFAVQLMIVGGVAFGVWGIIDSVAGSNGRSHRLEAHFLNPNTAGTVFAVLLCLASAEAIHRLRSADRGARFRRVLPQIAAALVFAICLLDTASRGAVLAALAGLLTYVALQLLSGRVKPNRAVLGALGAISLLLVAGAAAGDMLASRAFEAQGDSISRFETWRAHWQAFLASPLFGYGLGSAETVNKTLLNATNYRSLWSIRAILNVYLQWIEEAGVVGAAPMFLCIGTIVFSTFQGYVRRTRMTGLIAGLIAADLVVLVHGASDFGLEVFSVAALWAWLLGIQFSLSQGSSR